MTRDRIEEIKARVEAALPELCFDPRAVWYEMPKVFEYITELQTENAKLLAEDKRNEARIHRQSHIMARMEAENAELPQLRCDLETAREAAKLDADAINGWAKAYEEAQQDYERTIRNLKGIWQKEFDQKDAKIRELEAENEEMRTGRYERGTMWKTMVAAQKRVKELEEAVRVLHRAAGLLSDAFGVYDEHLKEFGEPPECRGDEDCDHCLIEQWRYDAKQYLSHPSVREVLDG